MRLLQKVEMINLEGILRGKISIAQWRQINTKANPEVFWSALVIICSNCFNINLICNLPTQCICMFCVIIRKNSSCFPTQSYLVRLLSNGDSEWLVCRWNSIFKFLSLEIHIAIKLLSSAVIHIIYYFNLTEVWITQEVTEITIKK